MAPSVNTTLHHLFWEAVSIEWRIVKFLGQAVAGAAVFVVVQTMNVIRGTAAFFIDILSLLFGFEVRTVVGISRADD